ncbi:tRNA-modifying protein YgfZ [Aliidiomarina sedimenti]|uniref:tRNA-modifying protein YgfZ n=1 Tax=Aliidiomarina sedimenti TaxID=1933879 RepID=A0ABY0C2K8_9GAMM|nr:tRNA-modifying protein YgfZ [Aliidiomarina sedimenti]RUO31974.1 tRNA-modifying protein YgfZ [Aliidiomarina sedimenti]
MQSYLVSQLAVVVASGADAESFLQGQLTADVQKLPPEQWSYAGHCDAKGKLLAVMRLWRSGGDFYLLMPRASIEHSLGQLKKFSVFSKVELAEQSGEFEVELSPVSSPLFALETADDAHFSLGLGDAQLRIRPAGIDTDGDDTTTDEPEIDDEAWLRYEIEHGVACLTDATVQQFVPQMVGLDRLAGINYKKGCYIGQETIARMHYLGQNKRAARYLVGSADKIPAAGADLERSLGESWRRAGAVLNAVRYDSGEVAVLAVLPADLENDATLRIKGDEASRLTPRPKFDNQEISNE